MRLLLPVGTRIIGQYQNGVSATQVRVGIRWERMVLPDGSSVVFDAPGMDPMGRIGIEASSIHTHFWKRFGDAGLYSVLSSGTQLSGGVDESTLTAGQLLRSQVSESFANTAMSDLEKNKSISPTIYLDPGSEISIFVRRDIVF
jgi:type IV secretion system protein VirB10